MEMIESEITEDTSIEEARTIWESSCTSYLAEETCFVKAKVADEIMSNLQAI